MGESARKRGAREEGGSADRISAVRRLGFGGASIFSRKLGRSCRGVEDERVGWQGALAKLTRCGVGRMEFSDGHCRGEEGKEVWIAGDNFGWEEE